MSEKPEQVSEKEITTFEAYKHIFEQYNRSHQLGSIKTTFLILDEFKDDFEITVKIIKKRRGGITPCH